MISKETYEEETKTLKRKNNSKRSDVETWNQQRHSAATDLQFLSKISRRCRIMSSDSCVGHSIEHLSTKSRFEIKMNYSSQQQSKHVHCVERFIFFDCYEAFINGLKLPLLVLLESSPLYLLGLQ